LELRPLALSMRLAGQIQGQLSVTILQAISLRGQVMAVALNLTIALDV